MPAPIDPNVEVYLVSAIKVYKTGAKVIPVPLTRREIMHLLKLLAEANQREPETINDWVAERLLRIQGGEYDVGTKDH